MINNRLKVTNLSTDRYCDILNYKFNNVILNFSIYKFLYQLYFRTENIVYDCVWKTKKIL